jgi:adsorption protein B
MVARQKLGGFIHSNGVGTGFSRRALEGLAARHANRIFEPGCLTEDYENGFRIAAMEMRQHFMPVRFRGGRPVATREFFPKEFLRAARQRSRWITGIQLQSWQLHSAKETLRYWYWFWRDRKGLIGNLVSPLTDVTFTYGVITRLSAWWFHHEWGLAQETASMRSVWKLGMALQGAHTLFRMLFAGRIYGVLHAITVPLRVPYANILNGCATALAIFGFARAKLRGTEVRWVKTEHAYPNRAALLVDRARLGDVLVGNQWLTKEQLGAALATKPPGRRLGEHLMALGLLTEEELYQALSLQNNLPFGKSAMDPITLAITRSLPAAISKKWRVLPFRIAGGELHVAGPDLPSEEMESAIRRFSSFELRFHLVTPTDYDELARQYLE